MAAVRSALVAAVDAGQVLLERDAALARIDQRLRAAIAGGGSLLLLEGPAGIGKTRLVLAAGRHGRELGLATLSARGSELERDFAYGLVRQLFEAPLVTASPPERAELLAGAAGRAAALFGVRAPDDDAADALLDPSFAILHGLYWLCANLARRSPLLLAIDDAHWADQASLRFLNYLGRRLEELPIAVIAAARPAQSAEGSPLLAALAADASAEVLALAPLSERAVAELVRLGLGAEVEPAFARACHEVTGGVPFLVHELVRAIAEAGIEATAAASGRVSALAPRAVSQSVVQRLNRLSAAARDLARAGAVLGEADLRLAAGLAGVDPGAATTAADELAAAGILEAGRPLRFVHPIVRAAVDADLSRGERAGLHAAAARRSRTRARLRTGSQHICWRPTPRGTTGSLSHSQRPPGPRSRTALRTRPSPICGARWRSRPPSGWAPTSCSSSGSPSHTLATRGRRPSRGGARCRSRRIGSGLDHARAGTHAPDRGPQPRGTGGVRPDARPPRRHRPTRGVSFT